MSSPTGGWGPQPPRFPPADAALRPYVPPPHLAKQPESLQAALAQRQARKLAAKPLAALIETKRLMKKSQAANVAERMVEEGASFARLLAEPAAREAFTAFMEKRQPDFSKI